MCRKVDGAAYCRVHFHQATSKAGSSGRPTAVATSSKPVTMESGPVERPVKAEPPKAEARKQLTVSEKVPTSDQAYHAFKRARSQCNKFPKLRKQARLGGCGFGPWEKVAELSGGTDFSRPAVVKRTGWKRRYVLKQQRIEDYDAACKLDKVIRLLDLYGLHARRIDSWHCDGTYYLVCEKLARNMPEKVSSKEVKDVLDLLQRMHNVGVIHGDSHDGNMMYDSKGRLKCIDLDPKYMNAYILHLARPFPSESDWKENEEYPDYAEACMFNYYRFLANFEYCEPTFKPIRGRLRRLMTIAGYKDVPKNLCAGDYLYEMITQQIGMH